MNDPCSRQRLPRIDALPMTQTPTQTDQPPQTPGKPPRRARRERFTVVIEAMPDPAGWRTPTYRLKLALKLFMRSFGFRCTSIATTTEATGAPGSASVPGSLGSPGSPGSRHLTPNENRHP